MKILITIIFFASLINCDVKKENERDRRSRRENLIATLYDNTTATITVKVDLDTYNKYAISEKYNNRTIVNKYIENENTKNAIYYFVTYRAEKWLGGFVKIVEFYFDKFYSKKAKGFEKFFLFWKIPYQNRIQFTIGFLNRFCFIMTLERD